MSDNPINDFLELFEGPERAQIAAVMQEEHLRQTKGDYESVMDEETKRQILSSPELMSRVNPQDGEFDPVRGVNEAYAIAQELNDPLMATFGEDAGHRGKNWGKSKATEFDNFLGE